MMPTASDMNVRFEDILRAEGYEVRPLQLQTARLPGRVAESPYFAVAFQPFELWADLTNSVGPAELEIESNMRPGSGKVWDAYFLLACQETLSTRGQFDELVKIQYDTRRMRKLVMPGVGESLSSVDDLVRPFLQLRKIEASSRSRDPLSALRDRIVTAGYSEAMIDRAVALFRETGALDGL